MSEHSRTSVSPFSRSRLKNFVIDVDDPNNIEEDPIDKDVETSEMGAQLAFIRKKYDKTKEANNKKQAYCEKLKAGIDLANASLAQTDQATKQLLQKIDSLKNSLELNKEKHETELQNKLSYQHVIERMKQEKIALEIKANSLQLTLKSSRSALNLETDKFIKFRESQIQSKQKLQEIKEYLAIDQRRKTEKMAQLEKNVKERQEFAQRREERQKKQIEISEAAANNKNSEEARVREKMLLSRLWFSAVKKKFEKETIRYIEIENAFQKIKNATGIASISEIVEKYLGREQSYDDLVKAVSDAEAKLEGLKDHNSFICEKLNKVKYSETGSSRKTYNNIDGIEEKLTKCYKDYASAKEKLQKSIVSYDQVMNWGSKILHTLKINDNIAISPGAKVEETKNTLEDMFSAIYKKLEEMIRPMEDKKEEVRLALKKFSRKNTFEIAKEITKNEELKRNRKIKKDWLQDYDEKMSAISYRTKTPEPFLRSFKK